MSNFQGTLCDLNGSEISHLRPWESRLPNLPIAVHKLPSYIRISTRRKLQYKWLCYFVTLLKKLIVVQLVAFYEKRIFSFVSEGIRHRCSSWQRRIKSMHPNSWNSFQYYLTIAQGHEAVQLVEVLYYKPENRRFESRLGAWIFFFNLP
jgi:hypothetical protein